MFASCKKECSTVYLYGQQDRMVKLTDSLVLNTSCILINIPTQRVDVISKTCS